MCFVRCNFACAQHVAIPRCLVVCALPVGHPGRSLYRCVPQSEAEPVCTHISALLVRTRKCWHLQSSANQSAKSLRTFKSVHACVLHPRPIGSTQSHSRFVRFWNCRFPKIKKYPLTILSVFIFDNLFIKRQYICLHVHLCVCVCASVRACT